MSFFDGLGEGSIWEQDVVVVSEISSLLTKPGTTLEDILGEDDVIQELSSRNTQLIDEFCKPDVLMQLVRYISRAPDGHDADKSYRFPYMACEVVCCKVEAVLEALAEDDLFLEELFSFLDTTDSLQPYRATYFGKVCGVLLEQKPLQMLAFFNTHKGIHLRLLRHLECGALVPTVLSVFRLPAATTDALYNLKLAHGDDHAMIEVLVRMLGGDVTLTNTPSAGVAEAASGAADVLCQLLAESAVCPPPVGSPAATTGPFPRLDDRYHIIGAKPADNTQHRILRVLRDGPLGRTLVFCLSKCAQPGSPLDNRAALRVLTTVLKQCKILKRPAPPPVAMLSASLLPLFCKQLQQPLAAPDTGLTLGLNGIAVTQCLAALTACGWEPLDAALVQHRIYPIFLDLMFMFPNNNILHKQVESVVRSAIQRASPVILGHLLKDCALLPRLCKACADVGGRAPHQGYVGHLLNISNAILAHLPSLPPPVVAAIEEDADWWAFVDGALADANIRRSVRIGGPAPDARAISAPGEGGPIRANVDEVDGP